MLQAGQVLAELLRDWACPSCRKPVESVPSECHSCVCCHRGRLCVCNVSCGSDQALDHLQIPGSTRHAHADKTAQLRISHCSTVQQYILKAFYGSRADPCAMTLPITLWDHADAAGVGCFLKWDSCGLVMRQLYSAENTMCHKTMVQVLA